MLTNSSINQWVYWFSLAWIRNGICLSTGNKLYTILNCTCLLCVCVRVSRLSQPKSHLENCIGYIILIIYIVVYILHKLHCCFGFPLLWISPFHSFLNLAELKRVKERITLIAWHFTHVYNVYTRCTQFPSYIHTIYLSTWSKRIDYEWFCHFTWHTHIRMTLFYTCSLAIHLLLRSHCLSFSLPFNHSCDASNDKRFACAIAHT